MVAGMSLLTVATATNLLELFPSAATRWTIYQWSVISITIVLCTVRLFENKKHMILRTIQPVINGISILALAEFFYVLLGLLLNLITKITGVRTI